MEQLSGNASAKRKHTSKASAALKENNVVNAPEIMYNNQSRDVSENGGGTASATAHATMTRNDSYQAGSKANRNSNHNLKTMMGLGVSASRPNGH